MFFQAYIIIIWVVLSLTFWFVSLTITKWQTISRLGFNSETPELYLRKPHYYHYLTVFMFIVLAVMCFFMSWLGVMAGIVLVMEGVFISIKGRISGVKLYKSVLKEMITYDDDKARQKEIEKILNKSDEQILSELKMQSVKV